MRSKRWLLYLLMCLLASACEPMRAQAGRDGTATQSRRACNLLPRYAPRADATHVAGAPRSFGQSDKITVLTIDFGDSGAADKSALNLLPQPA